MGWLFELAIQIVAELFGAAVGRKRPWWVEVVASVGCLMALGLPILIFLLLLR